MKNHAANYGIDEQNVNSVIFLGIAEYRVSRYLALGMGVVDDVGDCIIVSGRDRCL